ncbi:hypothetical protein ACH4SK_19525 [Streptomyces inhibens]|uniref:hypothetical protein n=1 Tax=Streptomyces inhibens TaxID=2293571 RepID=UPI0037991DD6
MRTRLAAGAVVAAALLTLFGNNVAGADGRGDHVRRHHGTVRLNDEPIRMTACALGTALGALTGRDNNCVADRLGYRRGDRRNDGRSYGNNYGRTGGANYGRSDGLSAGRSDGLGAGRSDGPV